MGALIGTTEVVPFPILIVAKVVEFPPFPDPKSATVVESHPNFAQNATLGWGTHTVS
jgi:hypothetical protein